MEAVAFSSNMATLVVSAGLDGRLVVWDTATFDSRNTCTHPQVGYSSCNAAVICTPMRTLGALAPLERSTCGHWGVQGIVRSCPAVAWRVQSCLL